MSTPIATTTTCSVEDFPNTNYNNHHHHDDKDDSQLRLRLQRGQLYNAAQCHVHVPNPQAQAGDDENENTTSAAATIAVSSVQQQLPQVHVDYLDWYIPEADPQTSLPQTIEDEAKRLRVLQSYQVVRALDQQERAYQLDRLATLARTIFPFCCMSFISIIDLGRCLFLAQDGIEVREVPRRNTFCSHALLCKDDFYQVRDAQKHPVFGQYPLVQAGLVQYYAAYPLTCPETKVRLGCFVLVGSEPRPQGLDEAQLATLKLLADQAVCDMQNYRDLRLAREQLQTMAGTVAALSHDLVTPLSGIKLSLDLLLEQPKQRPHHDENDDDEQTKQSLQTVLQCASAMEETCHKLRNSLQASSAATNSTGATPAAAVAAAAAAKTPPTNATTVETPSTSRNNNSNNSHESPQDGSSSLFARGKKKRNHPSTASSSTSSTTTPGDSCCCCPQDAASSTLSGKDNATQSPESRPTASKMLKRGDELDNEVPSAAAAAESLKDEELVRSKCLDMMKRQNNSSSSSSNNNNASSSTNHPSCAQQHQEQQSDCRTALIVEDSALVRKILARALERLGWQTHQATNGQEGLSMLQAQLYDVCFMDFLMPVMDGFDCCRLLRAWEAKHRLNQKSGDTGSGTAAAVSRQRIVGMSAHASPKDIEQSLLLGMDDFMHKPLTVTDLKRLLEDLPRIPTSQTRTSTAESTQHKQPKEGREHTCLLIGFNDSSLSTMVSQVINTEDTLSGRWTVTTAASPAEGITFLRSRHWSVVLVDNACFVDSDSSTDGKLSGTEFLQEFRAWERENRIHLQRQVFLCGTALPNSRRSSSSSSSSSSTLETSTMGLPSGVDGTLAKPIAKADLVDVLQSSEQGRLGEEIITRY